MDYPPRIYDFTLHVVGLIVGAALIVGHLYALLRTAETQKWLISLPRSKSAGIGILALDAVWCFWLVSSVDLEEFGWLRVYLQIAVPVLFVLTVLFVEEFLAARALGILAMLVAEPILSAAFLRDERSRLLLVVLAYIWLTLGMFWVGKPYLLRDHINWITKSLLRWRALGGLGVLWGALIFSLALFAY
jgi:hypothetical protein